MTALNVDATAAENCPKDRASEILESISSIPPLPTTAIKLSHILADPGAEIKDIAEVIQYDPTITANLLRLCNAAYFGFTEKVSSVKDAVVRLGTAKVFQLAMASSSRGLLSKNIDGYQLNEGQLWRHSVGAAVSAQKICEHFKLGFAGAAFTAALLHDMGKLLLDQYVGVEYKQLVDLSKEKSSGFNEAEAQLLGIDHAELGARLGEAWGMPDTLIECIRFHHNPQGASSDNAAVHVVCLADLFAMSLGFGLGADGLHYRADAALMDRLSLNREELDRLCAKIMIEYAQVEELFASA